MDEENHLNNIKIRIKYIVTFDDYLKYVINVLFKFYIIFYILLFMIFFKGSKDLVVSIIEATIVFIINFTINYFIIKMKYSTNKLIKKEITIELNDDSITEKNEFFNSTVKLEGIYKFKEDSSSYYIYISYGKALIIPKRYLSLKEHIILQEIISKNYKKNFKFRKITDFKDKERKYKNAFKTFLLIFQWSLITITVLAYMGLNYFFKSDSLSYYPFYVTRFRYLSYISYILPLSVVSIVLRNNWILSKYKM